MTEQERAREKAIRELTRLLRPVTSLKNPEAAATQFVDWLIGEHWRQVPPPPEWVAAEPNPEAYERGAELARELLGRTNHDA